MTFRTKFVDNQLNFGSGSNINTDDIPEGTQNFWLTTGSQDISGSKHFSDNILTDGNVYINYNGPDGDSYLYFYDNNSPTEVYLKWSETNGRFEFNASAYIGWALGIEENVVLNVNNADRDAVVIFKKPTSGDETLRWDKTDTRFEFSDGLYIDGTITALTSGSILQDVRVNGDLQVGGDTTVSGVEIQLNSGSAFLGDGSKYVSVPDSAYLNPADITFEAWIYINSLPNAYNSVVSKEAAGKGYTLLIKSNGKLAVYVTGIGSYDGNGTYTLTTGVWYHVAFTVDGDNLIGYVNRNVDKTVGASTETIQHSSDVLKLGASYFANREFNGKIDEAKIYDAALSADEIEDHYNNGGGVYGTNTEEHLTAGWHFDENTGTSASDYSGNGNTGTLQGGASWTGGIIGIPGIKFLDGDDVDYLTYNSPEKFRFSNNLTVAGEINVGTITVNTSGSSLKDTLIAGQLQVGGNVIADGNIYINYNGPDGDSYLYFYEDGSPTKEYLKWDDSSDRFEFSDSLYVGVALDVAGDAIFDGDVTANYDLTVDGILTTSAFHANGNIYINYDGPDESSYLYFYEDGNPGGAFLRWENHAEWFALSHRLVIPEIKCRGDIHINDDGPDGDSYLYFWNNGSSSGSYLKWDDTGNYFMFSNQIVAPSFASKDNIYINATGPDGDSYSYFYNGGSPIGEHLKWDDGDNRFEFSTSLYVGGTIAANTSGSSLKDTLIDGQLQTTEDVKVTTANGQGVQVKDKADGTVYRIYVLSGSVACEAV